jgi:hypothetical protein
MREREKAIGKKIYYGPGARRRRQAQIRENFRKALQRKTD